MYLGIFIPHRFDEIREDEELYDTYTETKYRSAETFFKLLSIFAPTLLDRSPPQKNMNVAFYF